MSNDKLPNRSFATHPTTGRVVKITKNVAGYEEINCGQLTAEMMNEIANVSPEQAEAMLVGSMFGWDVPGANPDYHKKQEDKTFWVRWVEQAMTTIKDNHDFPFWCTGHGVGPDLKIMTNVLCGVVTASSADAAREKILSDYHSGFITFSFCDEKEKGWMPSSDRFPSLPPAYNRQTEEAK